MGFSGYLGYMMRRWEVFDPTDGVAQVVTRFKWAAMFIAWVDGLDYALEGEGWCDGR